MAFTYKTISTELNQGVLTATISNPPINIMTLALYLDLVAFTQEVQDNDDVKDSGCSGHRGSPWGSWSARRLLER